MSEFLQSSFVGGMNLLADDTKIAENEYREAFNLRSRYDRLDPVKLAVEQADTPAGLKQGLTSFGDYLIMFVAGSAWYKNRAYSGWTQIAGFSMSTTVERYYFCAIPVTTTRYARKAVTVSSVVVPNNGIVLADSVASSGDLPGLLVQDGLNQAQFIYLDGANQIQVRTTQKYSEWNYDSTGVADAREYVPIGTYMEWMDGVLYIVAPNLVEIYRSVSGRPLDFMVNVDANGDAGGDASTTSYSVGGGLIRCMKSTNGASLFIGTSSGASYAVSLNKTPNAPTIFGEYLFTRQFLFSTSALSDKAVVDILGDTAFIEEEGLRSFNAVLQTQNEGRNTVFSNNVTALFRNVLQTADTVATINHDNYAIFGVNTIYGYVLLVFDTLNQKFVSIDTQTSSYIRQFAKINTTVVELYAITGDNKLLKLYGDSLFATTTCRFRASCGVGDSGATPKNEIKPTNLRCVLNNVTQDSTVTARVFVNNRPSTPKFVKQVKYVPPVTPYVDEPIFDEVNTQVSNLLFTLAGCGQGWKAFPMLSWTGGGSIVVVQMDSEDLSPMNPLRSQQL